MTGASATECGFPLSRRLVVVLIIAVAAGAFLFRLPRLDLRPLHGDEANQTFKTGILINTGEYRYDPNEHHGPTLYYFAWVSAWLSGAKTFAQTSEFTFRIVPVLFGAGLVLLLWPLARGLGHPAALAAALLTAISPAMVYYSRYYIQETLLVFFTFAAIVCGWRYTQRRSINWAVAAGLCLGLMHATKETCVLAFAAMFGALILTQLWARWHDGEMAGRAPSRPAEAGSIAPPCGPDEAWPSRIIRVCSVTARAFARPSHMAVAAAAAAVVSLAFFSSFFTYARGPLDSILTYAAYFGRALGEPPDPGTAAHIHNHPWFFYLALLLYFKNGPGPWWSEAFILVLALAGIAAALTRKPGKDNDVYLLRFLAFYTVLITAAYAVIPYKTPWCLLSFLHAMILMAGVGAVSLFAWMKSLPLRAALALLLAAGLGHLAFEAYRANYVFPANPNNPYVYAHAVPDVLRLAERVDDIAKVSPEGRHMLIEVIEPDGDYWPLPFYLRGYDRVGYWTSPPADADASLIITSPKGAPALEALVRDTYKTSYFGLRPNVLLLTYVRMDLWEKFIETRR